MVLRNSYEGELHAFRAVFRRHRFGATSYVTKKGFPQMSFGKKIIAGVAAVATLAALAPAVAMADTAQNQNSATSSQAKEEYATVTFYTADGHSIQGVTWQKGTAFSQYALGIQAPTIEGKTFTGWAYSEGTMLKDTDQVFADIAVYATYADTPTQDDNTQYTVSFYAGADQLIQTVSYYAKDKVKFSTYAAGIQAPAVEGKTFTGWGFASNDGDVAVDPNTVVTGNWAVYPMYKNAEKKDDTTQNVVSFYAGTDQLIQTVGYYAKDKVKFSQYALGIQAPAVEGKIFTGWGFASNDGDVPVDPDMVVTGNWAVYAMYKDAPTDDSKKDDSKPADTTKKNDTKGNTKKTVAQKIKKAVLGNTGATVGGVAVFAVIALLGFAGITVLRKRA